MKKGYSRKQWLSARTGKKNDRRRTITEATKEEVKQLYISGSSIREIERSLKGKISRRSIQFILFPERLTALQDHNKKIEHWKRYYTIDGRRNAQRHHRKHIKSLLDKKIIQ